MLTVHSGESVKQYNRFLVRNYWINVIGYHTGVFLWWCAVIAFMVIVWTMLGY